MRKSILVLAAAFFGLIAVAFGAFGAHGLKKMISPEYITMWEKGVQYQFYHALGINSLCALSQDRRLQAGTSMRHIVLYLGILFFSGSLYLLATRELTGMPTGILRADHTSWRASFLSLGWGLILVHALKERLSRSLRCACA
jgi:uncharacterized membrane protein YgdD (TMEM256/DUF423 family)